jgi:Zn-dependent protease with chaperone function
MAIYRHRLPLTLGVIALAGSAIVAQTPVKLPKNNFAPKQDVEIGMKAASEVRQQYPIIKDETIAKYLTALGDRLVAAAPPELKLPEFQYSFTPVDLKDINAFALPGGPMFVQRGMFEAAAGEGEVVGVMAHELSHVLLRHGTANASKAQNPWLQIGQLAGQIGGAMVGGGIGAAIAQGSEFGLGTLMLRYSRDFEKQADLLGAQIMARAGYDPRELAHMFETIGKESEGNRDPQWMSSHPNPGNRTAYITKEAAALTIGERPDTKGFDGIKTKFAGMPPAITSAELARRSEPKGNALATNSGTPGNRVPPPSTQFKEFSAGGIFRASVPANWTPVSSSNAVKVVPENAYGKFNGQVVLTHGVEFGVARASSRDLQEATNTWLKAIAQGNPSLRLAGDQQFGKMAQRTTFATPLSNPSPLGGNERIGVYTTLLADGNLFYFLTVVPEGEMEAYHSTFSKIAQSIVLTDAR